MPDRQEGMRIDREDVIVREIDPIPITRKEIRPRSGCESIARSIHKIFNLIATFTTERGLVLKNECYEYFADIFDFILQRAASVCGELGLDGDIAQGILKIENRYPGASQKMWYFLPLALDKESLYGVEISVTSGILAFYPRSLYIGEGESNLFITGVVINGVTSQLE